ncbi:MAG TPA: hypothetical protein VHX60_11475 [Acidobacteriaceae bacterium]|nr:hypothetical protein [Acidobacteriaceae bacterium]
MNHKRRALGILSLIAACGLAGAQQRYDRAALASPTLPNPISVYDNWSTYDELSDHVPLTEALTMQELDQLLRLRRAGARFDYYVIDAFWFSQDGAYRAWRTPNWPNGPDAWLTKCKVHGILPGLWFSTNTLVHLVAAPAWRDSLNKQDTAMSMFEGGFLPDFVNVLQFWYDHGVRMFLFDFADLTAATPHAEATLSKEEIVRRNSDALREALAAFRRKNPGVVLEAFNGFGGTMDTTSYPFPFKDPVDLRWLQVFDALYSGDPRPGDVPEMNFWRTLEIYSDHQARRYEQSGLPLERIDTTSFMPGKTGTIYRRAFAEWKGSLLLMLARGGWINTTYGNLELMSAADAHWFARAQSLFLHLQAEGRIRSFGGIPGDAETYGFGALDADGSVYVVVNPAQDVATIRLPLLAPDQKPLAAPRLLFRDAGFVPRLTTDSIQLGPGQMAMIGYGKYASDRYNFGVQQDIVIPDTIRPIAAEFKPTGKGEIQATLIAPAGGDLRIVMQQRAPDGSLRRTWAGDVNMGQVFLLHAEQDDKPLPIRTEYDKVVWAGLSWAAGEISRTNLRAGHSLTLTLRSTEKDPVTLTGSVYLVTYTRP